MSIFSSHLLEAVLFDLDGTLIDSIGVYYQIVSLVLERLGLPQVTPESIQEAAEQDPFDWLRVMPNVDPSSQKVLVSSAWDIAGKAYPALFRETVKLIDGAVPLLNHLVWKGLKIGIVTSTSRIHLDHKMAILEKEGIANLVSAVITADDAPSKKPAPDPLILCASHLGIPVSECVYIGDTRMDIQAGKAAGMRTIAVLSGFDREETLAGERPDALIPSVGHLKDLLTFSD